MTVSVVVPPPKIISSLDHVAPHFRAAIEAILHDIPDAIVYESVRTQARQLYLWRQGRGSQKGPIVTNARNVFRSWHGYGLACDIIHREKGWSVSHEWWAALHAVAHQHGCHTGLEWVHFVDPDHVQWPARSSPLHDDWTLAQSDGVLAVQKKYDAA